MKFPWDCVKGSGWVKNENEFISPQQIHKQVDEISEEERKSTCEIL